MDMKKLFIVVLMTTGFITHTQATEVVAADNSRLTKLCVTAAAGNIAVMHNMIKTSGYSRSFIIENIQCNGENIISFIKKNGSNADSMIRSLDHLRTKTTNKNHI